MSPHRAPRFGIRRLLRLPPRTRSRAEADADAELQAFIAERTDFLMAHGLSEPDARAEALRRLGVPLRDASALLTTSVTTRERRMQLREMIGDFSHDIRYALRSLQRDTRFAVFATAIVALGIGASVVVFSVATALLVRPLPFRDPDRLVWIANGQGVGLSNQTMQGDHFLDLAAQNHSFSGVAGYFAFYGLGDAKLASGNDAVRLSRVPVTQQFFPLLGVRPALGRNFNEAESAWGGPPAVLLSHAIWESRFGSDPAVVGRPLTLDDESVMVVGVLPASFDFGSIFAPGTRIDLFVPFPLSPETNRWGNTLAVIGRLAPTATVASAAAEMKVLAPRISADHPDRNGLDPVVSSLREHVSGRTQPALIVLGVAVAVVMLIVCANLSNLLLARATGRQKEMAIRAAIGAGRRRLIRQMLTESVVLSSLGAAAGLVLAFVGTRAIAHMSSVNLPLLDSVRIDGGALTFAVLLALVAGLAFGLVPALQISEGGVHEALKASGRSATDGRRGRWTRSSLVVSEIALACILLVGSGLLIRSFLKVLDVDLGFRPERVAALRVDPPAAITQTQARMLTYVDEVLARSKGLPGVQAVALSDGLPLGSNRSWGLRAKGQSYKRGEMPGTFIRVVSEGYIGAMGMSVREGRDLSSADGPASEPVVMLNETAARTLWPGESALGKYVLLDRERRVVGVIGDVRHLALEQASGLESYLPLRQTGDFSSVTLVVRSTLPPASLGPSLRNALASVAPNLPTNEIRTLSEIIDRAVSPRRFFTVLVGGFASFALILALLGIYGVISYTVSHRTQEIGVRIALGASSRHVQGRILRETLGLAAVGIVLGTVGAWALGHSLGGFLYGVTAADPVTFVAMLVLLTAVAGISGYLPARRASRIDPVSALRGE